MKYDVVILTDARYVNPKKITPYNENVLLEDRLVQEALQRKGLSVTRKAWDDPNFDWTTTRYALFRTTWDCFERYNEFSDWFKRTKKLTQFINSEDLITWNIDKHYLLDLHKKGVNIPKTFIVEPGSKTTLADSIKEAQHKLNFSTNDLVLKPCIAGAARHTYKFNISESNSFEGLFQELISKEAMMLQEFQKNIVAEGEISMMLFNGEFSHAVLKIAKPGDFRVQDDFGGSVHNHTPSEEEIDFAKQVVAASPEMPVYARVDMFKDNDSKWALAELEIFEPELWFRVRPEAATQLADCIYSKLFHEKVL